MSQVASKLESVDIEKTIGQRAVEETGDVKVTLAVATVVELPTTLEGTV